MRTILLFLLISSVALGQNRIIILRPGHRPLVVNRRPGVMANGGTYQGRITVAAPNRFDWQFAAPPGTLATMPKDAEKGGFAESYQLMVPPGLAPGSAAGLVLNVSASSSSEEFGIWEPVCRKHGLAYVCPIGVGDEVHPGLRLRTAVAVLDDIRQRMLIDTDRIYLTGTGHGSLTACQMAYSFPEFVGGLIAVGSATSLRAEPWLRDRVRERLSVVLLTGNRDPNRHELQRVRAAVLKQSEINHRLIVVPEQAEGLPPSEVLDHAVAWLESGRAARLQLSKLYPATRVAEGSMPQSENYASALVEEAKERLRKGRKDEGLMLLVGVMNRWPTTPGAREAKRLLEEQDAKGKRTWKEWYDARQLEHFHREARAIDELIGLLGNVRGAVLNAGLLPAAIAMYEQVEQFGPDTKEGKRASQRLEELRKIRDRR